MTSAIISRKEVIDIIFSGSREPFFEKKIEEAITKKIYELNPDLAKNFKFKIVISILLHGNFQAVNNNSTEDNLDDILQIIGDINECIIKQFLD